MLQIPSLLQAKVWKTIKTMPLRSLMNQSIEPVQKGRRRHPVTKIFFKDILKGLGLRKERVVEEYGNEEECVRLEQRIQVLRTKMQGKKSSGIQYIRTFNLFLLWMHHKWLQKWSQGILRIGRDNAYMFLEEYKSGEIVLSGEEPALKLVLDGDIEFVPKKRVTEHFSASNGQKILSVLTFLNDQQACLLNEDNVQKLRLFSTISDWEENLVNEDVENKKKRNLDRQKVVTTTECPLMMKTRQSQYWLLHPSNESVRNRALSLCQCFSISRFSDVSKWQMSDLTTFTYSHELPCTGPYSVEVLY